MALLAVVDQVVLLAVLLVSLDFAELDSVHQGLDQVAFDQTVLVMSESDQELAVREVFGSEELGLVAFDQVVEHLYPVDVAPVDDNLEHEDHRVEHLPSLRLLLQNLVNPRQLPNIPNFCVDAVERELHRSIFL